MSIDTSTCYIDSLYYDKYYYDRYEETESLAEVEEEQQQEEAQQQAIQTSKNEIEESYKGSYVNVTI